MYENILKISKTTEDPGLEYFLDDFIKEQLDSQYNLGMQIKKLELIGNNGHGFWEFDKSIDNL